MEKLEYGQRTEPPDADPRRLWDMLTAHMKGRLAGSDLVMVELINGDAIAGRLMEVDALITKGGHGGIVVESESQEWTIPVEHIEAITVSQPPLDRSDEVRG